MASGINGRVPTQVSRAVPLVILAVLAVASCATPVFFENTLGLDLYEAVSPLFWAALGYGLVFPFVSRRNEGALETVVWGAIVFGLLWGYLVAAEPGVRYWDTFAHSETTYVLVSAGVEPGLNRYLLWPSSFILHGAFSTLAGLPVLDVSKSLAVIFILLIGAASMRLFLLFFHPRDAFLCLLVFSLTPNSLILNHQHYSPQTVAYFLSLLILPFMYRGLDRQRSTRVLFTLLLFSVVMLHPVTSLLLFPVFVVFLVLNRATRRPLTSAITGPAVILFLTSIAAWWTVRTVALGTSASLLSASVRRLWDAVTLGEFRLSEGLFRPAYQPAYSQVIRGVTFGLLGITVAPSLAGLARSLFKATKRSHRLEAEEVFFSSILLGAAVSTVLAWVATGGLYGDRAWGVAAPVVAILCTRSLVSKPTAVRMRQVVAVLATLAVALVPLNFLAVNYTESQRQTSLAEMAAIEFLRAQSLRYHRVFSDSDLTLIRLRYAFQDGSNVFLRAELDPGMVGNSSRLATVPWTCFVHTERSATLLLSRYGVIPGSLKELDLRDTAKVYDNGELRLYERPNPVP